MTDVRPADLLPPELERLTEQAAGLAQSEEDVLTVAMFPEIGRQFPEQRAAGTLEPEPLEPPPSNGPKTAPTEFNIALHGEIYHVKITGAGHKGRPERHFYLAIDGVPEEVVVETLDEVVLTGGTEGAVK